MNQYQLSQLHAEVSLEFSNPFAKLGDGSLNRFKNFIDNAVKYTNELLSKIDKTHPNGLFNRNDDIQNKIKEKQIVYSDWGYLTVFCPSYLKEGVQMIDLAKALESALDTCKLINQSAPLEAGAIFNAYLGNTKRLHDPALISIREYAPTTHSILIDATEKHNKVLNKLITSTGSHSEREYRKLYGRTNDYYATNDVAAKINKHYADLTYTIHAYMKQCADANQSAADLLKHLEANPDVKINPAVASYLTDTMYRLGLLTTWLSSTLYNSQYFLKAMTDTNEKIRMVLSS